MFIKSKTLIFIPSLILGTLMAISSSSWMTAWLGMEINLMSMTPILINKMTFHSVESSIKYFLTQTICSSVLIFFISLNFLIQEWNLSILFNEMMIFMLLFKAGAAPLHFWFPQVIKDSNWMPCLILLTWQKIAPFILISYNSSSSILPFFIISSCLIGVLGAINQTHIKIIMAYSSILNSAWLLSLTSSGESIWWMYFITYSFLCLCIIIIPLKFNINKINNLFKVFLPSLLKLFFLINLLSLAGMPPFLGFFVKLISINSLIEYHSMLILFSLISASFLAFYFYIRLIYSDLFMNSGNMSAKQMYSTNYKSILTIMVSYMSISGISIMWVIYLFI